ncbi:MAG: FMN-binding protein [Treponema sp.]|nr:FMN-binding protein [Treponema sp.]
MKYFLFLTLIVVSGCALLGGLAGEVFEGTGQGYRGPVTVQVRMNGADITEIVIVDSEEDRFVGTEAMEELADLVIYYNSTDVDAVSGATQSSRGFLEAVENAIIKR